MWIFVRGLIYINMKVSAISEKHSIFWLIKLKNCSLKFFQSGSSFRKIRFLQLKVIIFLLWAFPGFVLTGYSAINNLKQDSLTFYDVNAVIIPETGTIEVNLKMVYGI